MVEAKVDRRMAIVETGVGGPVRVGDDLGEFGQADLRERGADLKWMW
ncbi:MAG TPA: hypothetical protein VMT46_06065 [Anaerolineaceae bacterium]|nr:hypothetical protein [Anaerolineaceae bacterium]